MDAGRVGEPTMSSEGLGRFRSVRSPSLVLPLEWEMRDWATKWAAPYFHDNWDLGDRQHFWASSSP